MLNSPSTEIESSGFSQVGPVREDNQDSIRLPEAPQTEETGYLFGLADGMGGYAYGQMASSMALEKVFETYYRQPNGSVQKTLQRGIEAANLSIYQAAEKLGAGRMGTTLTAASIVGNQLTLAHIGDSRAYLIRNGRSTCLTTDHTMVGDLVQMRVITPDKVRTHSQRSILTRAVGLSLFVEPDIQVRTLRDGDQIILCSDGVWSVIQDQEFGEIAQNIKDAATLSQEIINLALQRDTDDNISAISIIIHSIPVVKPGRERKKWSFKNWLGANHIFFQIARPSIL